MAELRRIVIEHEGVRTPVWHRPGGRGRWALLLHGACADHRSMLPLMQRLDPEIDMLLPDLRGQGESELGGARALFGGILGDLDALLARVGAERIDVIGHSYGSHLAQELAVRRPGRVRRLVLIGCYDQHGGRGAGERMRVAATTAVVRLSGWPAFSRFSANVATKDAVLRAELLRTHLAAGASVFLDLGRSASVAKRSVDRYAMPVLLLRGEREYSRRLAELHGRIAARSAQGRTLQIAGTGHLAPQEDPAAVGAAVAEFLAEA